MGLAFMTRDGGQHWEMLGRSAGGYFASHALWRSDDHGETWTKVDERLAACAGVHPRDPERVYLAAWAGDVSREKVNVYRSVDGGKNWMPIADNIP
jgi:photosystem II stability/assembly factor-like uncharacterized protein